MVSEHRSQTRRLDDLETQFHETRLRISRLLRKATRDYDTEIRRASLARCSVVRGGSIDVMRVTAEGEEPQTVVRESNVSESSTSEEEIALQDSCDSE